MKSYFHAFAMCQSMFCAIPFPGNLWDEKARDKMLLFLPLVGLEMGAIWAALALLDYKDYAEGAFCVLSFSFHNSSNI